MQHFHAVIWIDHLEARVFHLGLSGLNEVILHPHLPTRHIHHKANSIGSGHVHESGEFLKQVLDAVSDAGEILILGPSGAKVELAKYIREHNPQIGDRIVAVEAADHPSDPQIIAHAKLHFKIGIPRAAADRA
ncbi:translational machinery protein [Bradyrhizobium sp. dw_411]|uniref:translational machinery protein n=1 Tax=Bradyrhizobium sp. dw_411 TaxID=2720082 RepID=UPI00201C3A81|nr:translational machinery protein [Bradyrhizobium sp. dw_411]